MYKYILESAGNINWMAIFALLTFMIIFIINIVLIFGGGKKFYNHMAALPLDDSQPTQNEKTKTNEK